MSQYELRWWTSRFTRSVRFGQRGLTHSTSSVLRVDHYLLPLTLRRSSASLREEHTSEPEAASTQHSVNDAALPQPREPQAVEREPSSGPFHPPSGCYTNSPGFSPLVPRASLPTRARPPSTPELLHSGVCWSQVALSSFSIALSREHEHTDEQLLPAEREV